MSYFQTEGNFEGKTTIKFYGQAGFTIKSKTGTSIGIDLYLSDYCEKIYGFKRLMPKIINPIELKLDAVLTSHFHYDHFDYDSVPKMLNENNILYATVDSKEDIDKLIAEKKINDNTNIVITTVGSEFKVKDITVACKECDHGEQTKDAVAYIINVDGFCIYIAGDTCFRSDYAKRIADRYSVDILIGPINGKNGNMNEEELVKLAAIIKPKVVVPSHYWCFAEHEGNPYRFIEAAAKRNVDTYIFTMGEEADVLNMLNVRADGGFYEK